MVPVIEETLGSQSSQSSLSDTDELAPIVKDHPSGDLAPIKWALKKWMSKAMGRKLNREGVNKSERYFKRKQLSPLLSSSFIVIAVLSFYFLFFRSS